MSNPGEYKHKIKIIKYDIRKDSSGYRINDEEITILEPYAKIKTTKGYTLIKNNSDFEKAYTNFTIRFSEKVLSEYNSLETNRKLFIIYKNKKYILEYLNNIDESNIELEMQCKLVIK